MQTGYSTKQLFDNNQINYHLIVHKYYMLQ